MLFLFRNFLFYYYGPSFSTVPLLLSLLSFLRRFLGFPPLFLLFVVFMIICIIIPQLFFRFFVFIIISFLLLQTSFFFLAFLFMIIAPPTSPFPFLFLSLLSLFFARSFAYFFSRNWFLLVSSSPYVFYCYFASCCGLLLRSAFLLCLFSSSFLSSLAFFACGILSAQRRFRSSSSSGRKFFQNQWFGMDLGLGWSVVAIVPSHLGPRMIFVPRTLSGILISQ